MAAEPFIKQLTSSDDPLEQALALTQPFYSNTTLKRAQVYGMLHRNEMYFRLATELPPLVPRTVLLEDIARALALLRAIHDQGKMEKDFPVDTLTVGVADLALAAVGATPERELTEVLKSLSGFSYYRVPADLEVGHQACLDYERGRCTRGRDCLHRHDQFWVREDASRVDIDTFWYVDVYEKKIGILRIVSDTPQAIAHAKQLDDLVNQHDNQAKVAKHWNAVQEQLRLGDETMRALEQGTRALSLSDGRRTLAAQ